MKTLHRFLWLCLYSRFLKKNNLPWSNQVFHEIFQLTVWVPLQWLEEDSKERQHEDQPLKEKQRLSWKASDFEKVRRKIVCRGKCFIDKVQEQVVISAFIYLCHTNWEANLSPRRVGHKFKMLNSMVQTKLSDCAKILPSCWLSPSLVQLCIQLARMELFFSIPQTQ